jgi:hypothetical protein
MPDPDALIHRLDLVTNRSIAYARLRNSRLVGPPLATPEEVVAWFGAVQSQDVPGALWGLAQRMPPDAGTTIEQLGAAMDEGRFVRTHGPRPTWHFIHPADLRWILSLVGPRVEQTMAGLVRRLGISGDEMTRGQAAMEAAMAGGKALIRSQLRDVVASVGIDVSEPLVTSMIGMQAEVRAVLCNGPRRGKQTTFVLVDDWVPRAKPIAPDDALRELTIRYFTSHGPALAHDMAWWSGLTVGSVREGIALAGAALEGRRLDSKDYWAASGTFDAEPDLIPTSHVLLLPNYDEAVASFSEYSPMMDDALPRPTWVNDALGAHIVLRDGFVVGGWRRSLARDRVSVTVTLLMPLTAAELAALDAAAERFGRFLGLPADLHVIRR